MPPNLNRDDFIGKQSFGLGLPGFVLAGDRKHFLLLATDGVFPSDIFSRFAHGHIGRWHALAQCRVRHRIKTRHRHAAHGLNTGADEDIPGTHLDRPGGHMNRLHGRTAKPVDRRAGYRDGKTGHEANQPRHIESLFALRKGTAQDKVFNVVRIDARALHQAFDNVCGEVVGPDFGQRAFSGEVKW